MPQNAEFETRLEYLNDQFIKGSLGITDFKRARNALIEEYGDLDEPKASQGNYGKSQ